MSGRDFGIGLASGAIAAAVVGLFVVPFLGLFDMDATGEPGILDWWGHTNWRASLNWRAPEAELPASADAMAGLREFGEYCIHCHGAPEISRAEWAKGMQPMPPRLWEAETQELEDGEIFRIIRGGVRMTGMPAFGPNHADSVIWNLVAAVRALDTLEPQERRILEEAGHGHGQQQPAADHHADQPAGQQPKETADHHSEDAAAQAGRGPPN